MRRRVFFLFACMLIGCTDFENLWVDPPYVVHWINNPDNVTLNYDLGDGGSISRVGPKVIAVGSNKKFVVAKQATGSYYFIEKSRDGRYLQSEAVVGPLNEEEFLEAQKRLSLPALSKLLGRQK